MNSLNNFNFKGERVLVRVDFNVPLNENLEITDDTRIRAALPTIKKILNDGGSAVLMSHLGRPKGSVVPEMSLAPVAKHLSDLLNLNVQFTTASCVSDRAMDLANNLKEGEVLLLENLRFFNEETSGEKTFAEKLSRLGSFYINDAFGTAHRAHASTAIIADFFPKNKAFGAIMLAEIENVNKVLNSTEKPVVAIVGGAKVSSKIEILKNLMDKVDTFLIGGGMAYTFLKAQGGEIGSSLVEDDKLSLALDILEEAKKKGVNFILPIDSIVADAFSETANTKEVNSSEIPQNWMGLDIGSKAEVRYAEILAEAKIILWNGPLGVFEMEAFSSGTKKVGQAIVNATKNGAFSLVGGGDSVAAVKKFGIADEVSYVSTGGGAMLEYLEGKTLPGIQAILK